MSLVNLIRTVLKSWLLRVQIEQDSRSRRFLSIRLVHAARAIRTVQLSTQFHRRNAVRIAAFSCKVLAAAYEHFLLSTRDMNKAPIATG